VRGGALDENRRAIEETAALAAAGAPGSAAVLVLVAGGLPVGDRDLPGARARARDAVGALVDDAAAAGVVLAIEPMHPIYAADRGVISTLGQALDIAEPYPATTVGVLVDTFHVWWDPQLYEQLERAGRDGRIAGYQVCDWITPLPDPLLGRGMMGEGHIDFPAVTRAVLAAGYAGDIEVEIFNQEIWDADPAEVARRTVRAFDACVAPSLLADKPVAHGRRTP
jgi:sugar phosphate isomerase/epimerase